MSEYTDKINGLKQKVSLMLQERSKNYNRASSQCPSSFWADNLSLFDYAASLSPENFLNIRFHAGYLSGVNVLQNWHQYQSIDSGRYADMIGYKFLIRDVPERYHIGEPPTPKLPIPLGIKYLGKVINIDIRRYQSCISNLYSMGILEALLKGGDKKVVMEIGAGYGGLAHHLSKILGKKCTYIILDLPEILLFSGGYLIVNNPRKKIYVYEKRTFTPEFLTSGMYEYDYVLLPNFALKDLYAVSEVNLMINMQSFQEMTREQIKEYMEFGHKKLSGYLYSDNMDRHPFTDVLAPDTVTTLMEERFRLFPPPEYYKKAIGYGSPVLGTWPYKCYAGILKDRSTPWNQGGMIKVVGRLARYSFTRQKNGVKFRGERKWLERLIVWGLKVVQFVMSRHRK